jgi:hypothetical protein
MSTSTTSPLPADATRKFLHGVWEADVLPALSRYITIPAKSPAFDADWSAHGHIDQAVGLIESWSRSRPIRG